MHIVSYMLCPQSIDLRWFIPHFLSTQGHWIQQDRKVSSSWSEPNIDWKGISVTEGTELWAIVQASLKGLFFLKRCTAFFLIRTLQKENIICTWLVPHLVPFCTSHIFVILPSEGVRMKDLH